MQYLQYRTHFRLQTNARTAFQGELLDVQLLPPPVLEYADLAQRAQREVLVQAHRAEELGARVHVLERQLQVCRRGRG